MADEQETKQSREEFQAARRELVDTLIADTGIHHSRLDGVAVGELKAKVAELVAEQQNEDVKATARLLGKTEDEVKAMRDASNATESTPEQRAANLPTGKAPTVPKKSDPKAGDPRNQHDEALWGDALMAAAANDELSHLWQK